jgi:thiamine pyrophosphate-dependent acetolactate synthase large subunit-like protein
MANEPRTQMDQARALYAALTGQPTHLAASLDEALKVVLSGKGPVVVELPWGEVHQGERHERHQVIVTRVANNRVYFINALKNKARPGQTLGGPGAGPVRRMEADGEESMDLAGFKAVYARGGQAMLSP